MANPKRKLASEVDARELSVQAPTPAPAPQEQTAREQILTELASTPPLHTGPQGEIPEPLPPIPAPKTLLFIPDVDALFDTYF